MIIEIEFGGEKKSIRIEQFRALDGWEIQNRFRDFAASTDKSFRREFTMEVIGYGFVVLAEGHEIQLINGDVIDNHLGTWQNVQYVFEEILRQNGIDPSTHADRPGFWANAGAEMAVAFLAETTKMMGPAMEQMEARFRNEG